MSQDNEDSEDINFDSDWKYCCLEQTIDPSSLLNSVNNFQWLSVSLPHIINKDLKINNSSNWCYRKIFNWIYSDVISVE